MISFNLHRFVSHGLRLGFLTTVSLILASSVQAQVDTTLQSNEVDFNSSSFNVGLNYAFTWTNILSSGPYANQSYSITSGQPWEGVTSSGGNSLQITALAGRQNSGSVVDFFTAALQGGDATAQDAGGALPGDLNFAFTGFLSINYTPYAIVLAQGHVGAQNNWWIGGPGFVKIAGNNSAVTTPDGLYNIGPADLSDYSFTVVASSYAAIPEPSSTHLFGFGVAVLVILLFRKRSALNKSSV